MAKNSNDSTRSSSISKLQNFLDNPAKCKKWIHRSRKSKSKEDTHLRIVTLLAVLVRGKEGGEIEGIDRNHLFRRTTV